MSSETSHTVVARKEFVCEGYRCGNVVLPGTAYARHVAFPSPMSEVNQGSQPWVLRICADCQAPKPMPARRLIRRTNRGEVPA